MRLTAITKDNWIEVLHITTNEDGIPTLMEKYVASVAASMVQAQFQEGWIPRAIEHEGRPVGFGVVAVLTAMAAAVAMKKKDE